MKASLRELKSPASRNYISGITVPAGALDRWYRYRSVANTAASRREVVVFGDSTAFGSGPTPTYSWVQRLRDRAVSAGYADGGKGIFARDESTIGYDSPEVNGFVSSTGTLGSADPYDTLAGQYWLMTSASATITTQFRTTGVRIWYTRRGAAGTFTYAIDGGAAVTVTPTATTAIALDAFVYVGGLSANTTHTLVITNGAASTYLAVAPVNDTGVAFQKHATSGTTYQTFFHGGLADFTGLHHATRYQAALGLVPTATTGVLSPTSVDGYVANNTVDTTYTGLAQIRPALAMNELGFNDLTAQTSADYTMYTEAIKKFGAACRATGCSGVILIGQLAYNSLWPTYGTGLFAAMKTTALAQGLAFADLLIPVSGPSLSYSGGTAQPHLTKTQYVAQADWLWDNLLSV